MTNEEALKRFKWKYNLTKDYNDPHWEGGERREHSEWVEQLEIAINALEKQIPKKPINSKMNWAICPNCGGSISKENVREHIVEGETSYCEHCGQKISWGSDT